MLGPGDGVSRYIRTNRFPKMGQVTGHVDIWWITGQDPRLLPSGKLT